MFVCVCWSFLQALEGQIAKGVKCDTTAEEQTKSEANQTCMGMLYWANELKASVWHIQASMYLAVKDVIDFHQNPLRLGCGSCGTH